MVLEVVQTWTVSIPIGWSFSRVSNNKEDIRIKIDEVLFHFRNTELVGTVALEGKRYEVEEKAKKLVDAAVTILCYLCKRNMDIVRDRFYIKEQSDTSWLQTTGKGLTSSYNIGEEEDFQTSLSKIASVKAPQKKEVLYKALGYYREALHSSNPHAEIERYLGCITAIVRENIGNNDVTRSDLKQQLAPVIGGKEDEFNKKFDRFYGKRRSSTSHGHVDIRDDVRLREARADSEELKNWTEKLISKFINEN
jgi:hypothetical protein